VIDSLAKEGNPEAFSFAKPKVADYNYSFSGLKTSFLYFLQKKVAENPAFVEENKVDLCASIQKTIIDILMDKLIKAAAKTGIKDVAIAGGVSANSGLAGRLHSDGQNYGWNVFVPERKFTADNAAMIAITGFFKYRKSLFSSLDATPFARNENRYISVEKTI
jgi:N6-L-threonylcarbamoyladenine synthase